MRLLGAIAASALSAFLYYLAFPPLSWRPAAWVALVPFLLAVRAVGAKTALFLGWLWLLVMSSLVADALPRAVETYFLQPPLESALIAVFVWTVTGSIYYVAFVAVYRALVGRWRRSAGLPLVVAAAWTAGEFARGRLFTGSEVFVGNPWGLVVYSQAGWDALLQIAAVTGAYGVSFCIAAVNAAVAELAMAVWKQGRLPRGLAVGALLALLPTAAALVYGHLALRAAPEPGADAEIEVAIAQANLTVGSRWRSDMYGAHLDEQLRLTWQAVTEGSPRIAFWSESALTFFLAEEPLYRHAIARLLAAGDLELVVGGPSVDDPDAPEPVYYNSIFVLDAGGVIRERYDKQYLVPFAEYLPLRRLDFLRRRFERVRVFRHGKRAPLLPTRAGPAGVLVCNEAMYPEVARRRVLQGAHYLVNPSNDDWVQDPVWADRMFDIVALRAVEQRRYLVRASTSGPSAIVDPWGRVLERTPPFESAMVVGRLAPYRERSVYGRVGDAFAWSCVLIVAAALAAGRLRERSGTAS